MRQVLVRHVLGYLPASVVPAIIAFASVYIYTRMLGPADYGVYSLVVSVTLLCQAAFHYWLQIGATRFYARAEIDAELPSFAGTVYKGTVLSSALLSVLYAAVLMLGTFPANITAALWIGLPLVLTRGLVSVNQAFNRGGAKIVRYNLIECSQTLLGLGFGVSMLMVRHDGACSALLGLVAGAVIACAFDLAAIMRGLRAPSVVSLRALISFGAPLTACYTLGFMLNTADRFVIQYVLGSSAVGIYSVAFNTIDRSIGSICAAISMAAFPLTARAFEAHGTSAARKQLKANGTLLLSIALPACAGLIATAPQICAVLIGPAFRGEALQIMPWIVLSALMSGLQIHYFNHAFYLGKRTWRMLWTEGPAAVLNLALNFIFLPRVGLMGAVWANLIAHAVALVISIALGRREFKFDFPFGSALRILLASVAMMCAIRGLNMPSTFVGLTGSILVGVAVYGGMCLALNVAESRYFVYRRVLDCRNWYLAWLAAMRRQLFEDE
jgi:O-antigen/teichoic acid export membrane protein